ncbi:MAG: DUF2384 domain-containing protein [Bacteroidetes bacterium]|nr:DUF2384 domain-containing protein [Bacteroidota bacterium]
MTSLSNAQKKALANIPAVSSHMDIFYFVKKEKIDEHFVNYLKAESSFSDDEISDWLNISVKTLRSYRSPGTSLKENLKEHLILILSLYEHGKEVFESAENFDKWLAAPNYYFDNQPPKEFLSTTSGIKFIDDQLSSIEYGDNV